MCMMCVHTGVSTHAQVSQCTSGGWRATLGAGPHLPPCFKQGLLVGLSLCKQEAGQPTSKDYSVSTSNFTAGARGLKTSTTTCDLLWVLRTHIQVLKFVWQVFDALALTLVLLH